MHSSHRHTYARARHGQLRASSSPQTPHPPERIFSIYQICKCVWTIFLLHTFRRRYALAVVVIFRKISYMPVSTICRVDGVRWAFGICGGSTFQPHVRANSHQFVGHQWLASRMYLMLTCAFSYCWRETDKHGTWALQIYHDISEWQRCALFGARKKIRASNTCSQQESVKCSGRCLTWFSERPQCFNADSVWRKTFVRYQWSCNWYTRKGHFSNIVHIRTLRTIYVTNIETHILSRFIRDILFFICKSHRPIFRHKTNPEFIILKDWYVILYVNYCSQVTHIAQIIFHFSFCTLHSPEQQRRWRMRRSQTDQLTDIAGKNFGFCFYYHLRRFPWCGLK